MADLNKSATLANAKKEFGSLSEAALKLYWAALQNSNWVGVTDLKAGPVNELIEAKMAKICGTGGSFKLVLTYKAAVIWPVTADKESRVPA